MQHWRQSDCVSADCWVTGSMGGPADSRRQAIFAVSMKQTAGQKWAPLTTLEWLDSSLVRCVHVHYWEQWWTYAGYLPSTNILDIQEECLQLKNLEVRYWTSSDFARQFCSSNADLWHLNIKRDYGLPSCPPLFTSEKVTYIFFL